MADWLGSPDGGVVPSRNLRLITSSASPDGTLIAPRAIEVEAAFEELHNRRAQRRRGGVPVQTRLTIVVVGPGFGGDNGQVTVLTANDANELVVGLELTGIANHFRDSRLFDEVVLFADVPRVIGHQGTPTQIQFGAVSFDTGIKPAAHFYVFSNHYGARKNPSLRRRFMPILIAGLEGGARDGGAAITSVSLANYLQRQYVSDSEEPTYRPEIQFSERSPITFSPSQRSEEDEPWEFASESEDEEFITEGESMPVGEGPARSASVPDLESSSSAEAEAAAAAAERRYGGGLKFRREAADDELCLNVENYANVLAQLFSGADAGEFCFAVYGHWGRGKTFLMRRVGKALDTLQKGCRTIAFSAWRYPSAPEVWVHLYEEFAKAAFEGPWYRTLPNIVRTGTAKHGKSQLLWEYALFAFSVIPLVTLLGWSEDVVSVLYPVIGVMGFVLLFSLVVGVKRTKSRLSDQYLTASRHTEKLGLQATIGSDLRALLKGWIPSNPFGGAFAALYWVITAGLIGAAILRLAEGKQREHLAQGQVHWALIWQPRPAIELGLVIGIIAMAAAVLYWLRHGGSSPNRVLLVVDDLDRCKPEHLLSVMESIKLLIEDPDISGRVQVAMLLEEDVLKHAIFEKYGNLTDEKRASALRTSYDADRLILENAEKLFTAHLRLPQLAKSELRDLIEAFSREKGDLKVPEAATERQVPTENLPSESEYAGAETQDLGTDFGSLLDDTGPDGAVIAGRAGLVIPLPQAESAPSAQAGSAALPPSHLRYHAPPSARVLEKVEIAAVLEALDSATAVRPNLGPRAIRAFLFRYQLARLLLDELAIPWDPVTLAESLVARAFDSSVVTVAEPISADLTDEQKLLRVVGQVW